MCRNDYVYDDPSPTYSRDYNDRWDTRNRYPQREDERDRLDRQIAQLERELAELRRRRGY